MPALTRLKTKTFQKRCRLRETNTQAPMPPEMVTNQILVNPRSSSPFQIWILTFVTTLLSRNKLQKRKYKKLIVSSPLTFQEPPWILSHSRKKASASKSRSILSTLLKSSKAMSSQEAIYASRHLPKVRLKAWFPCHDSILTRFWTRHPRERKINKRRRIGNTPSL